MDDIIFDCVPTEGARRNIIDNISARFDFMKIGSIGKSLCQRSIDFLSLGNPENRVFLAGSFHGMERLTQLVLLKFAYLLCKKVYRNESICGVNLKKNLEKTGVMIVPCVNPDGTEISLCGSQGAGDYKNLVQSVCGDNTTHWQANARGVDLNHNYSSGWEELHLNERQNGITGPFPTRYGGERPESEPETIAITRLCRENKFIRALAFHSQGEEIYWKYGKNNPENSEILAKALALSSGYNLSSPEGLAVGGGFKDWFITEFNRPGFTIEIGKGNNPLPIEDFQKIYDKIENMLFMSVLL